MKFKEDDTIGLFDNRNSSECEASIADLMDKKNVINEEFRNLKREKQIQPVRMCEMPKLKKKAKKDKVMIEEDKRVLVKGMCRIMVCQKVVSLKICS